MTESQPEPLARLRALCLAQPNVTERLSHGEPAWFVADKRQFVTFADHHHDDRLAFWAAAPPDTQEILIENDPVTYFRPPYVGHRGWIGVYLDVPIDWDQVALRVSEAYSTVARR